MNAEESAKREMEQHIPNVLVIETLDGEKMEIPLRLSWSQELQVIALFQDVLKPEELGTILTGAKKVAEARGLIEEDKDDENGKPAERVEGEEEEDEDEDALNQATLSSLKQYDAFLGMAPKIGRFVEIIVKKDEAWISENLNLELMLKVIIPFVQRYKDMLTSLIQQFSPPEKETVEKVPIQ